MPLKLSKFWVRAYEKGNASSVDIAHSLSCSPATVLIALRDRGIFIRGRGRPKGKTNRNLSKFWVRAYEKGKASSVDIAQSLSSSPSTVLRALRDRGVFIRGRGRPKGKTNHNTITVPADLAEAYRNGQLTGAAIAEKLGHSPSIIYGALKRLGIPLQSNSDRGRPRRLAIIDAYRNGATMAEVAKIFQISTQRVNQILAREAPEIIGRPRAKKNQNDPPKGKVHP